jgi:hypothetical protein
MKRRELIKTKVLLNLTFTCCFTGLLFMSCSEQKSEWNISNREKTLTFSLKLANHHLKYTIIADDGTVIVEPSAMGILRADNDFASKLIFAGASDLVEIADSYQMITGKQSKIEVRCNEQKVSFKNKQGQVIQIIVRAYPDGVAFRYAFPEKKEGVFNVTGDATTFNMPEDGIAWMHPYSKVDTWAPAYETEWENSIKIGTPSPDTVGWAMPALFNAIGWWTLVTESGVDTSCFVTHFEQKADSGVYVSRLPETDETYGVAPQYAQITLPWVSPWKTFIIGNSPKTILESNLVTSLSTPCVLSDTGWIKPGRVSWSWWSDGSSPWDFKKLLPFIDLSAYLGWEYSLIDLGWHNMNNGGNIRDLIKYANSKNVGLILWYNSGGDHNRVKDACPCDIINDPVKRRQEFKKLAEWGIKGVKVDFMQSDKQYILKLYQDILLDAAQFNLVVDFHGSTIPRGWARTYPNLLSQEGIRGAEQYWDTIFAENAHTFNTIYTFTRNVVGSMDYTPVIFSFPRGKVPHSTTNAHELATSVAFESGLQHFADDAASYLAQPSFVLDFLREVPVNWDETKYLDGYPGKLTLIARRKGDKWFVAGLNGLNTNQTVNVKFDFIEADKAIVTIIKDGKDQLGFEHEIIEVEKDDKKEITLKARGGFVISLKQF